MARKRFPDEVLCHEVEPSARPRNHIAKISRQDSDGGPAAVLVESSAGGPDAICC